MYVGRVTMRNFRCFRNATVDLDAATVVVGPNDAGKSTLLQAIHWVIGWSEYVGIGDQFAAFCSWPLGGEQGQDSVVTVVLEFVDLDDRARDVWPWTRSGGPLRIGRRVPETPTMRSTGMSGPMARTLC